MSYCSFKINNKACRKVANETIRLNKTFISRCIEHKYTGTYESKGICCICYRGKIPTRAGWNKCLTCNGKGHL